LVNYVPKEESVSIIDAMESFIVSLHAWI
jgi:hypothetical protein